MAISNSHPRYLELREIYELMDDCFQGERQIKKRGTKYLKPTAYMISDGFPNADPGKSLYQDYLDRASYYNVVYQTLNNHLGVLHQEPANIILPEPIRPLENNATIENESLQEVLQKINEHQFLYGRTLALLDFTPNEMDNTRLPKIFLYPAPSVINWSDKNIMNNENDFIVLKEDYYEIVDFQYQPRKRYRVLQIIDGTYHVGIFGSEESYDPSRMVQQTIMGRPITEIPAVFANVNDITRTPAIPPLLDLADTSIHLYRQLADYNIKMHNLIVNVLVLIAGQGDKSDDDSIKLSPSSYIKVPNDGDVKFISPTPDGLKELRDGIINTIQRISHLTGILQSNQGTLGNRESGEALSLRINNSQSTVVTIALTGALCIQELLKIYARAVNISESIMLDPRQFSIVPNTDFSKRGIIPENLTVAMEMYRNGFITKEQVYDIFREMTGTQQEWDEVRPIIERELETQNINQQNNLNDENTGAN